MRRVSERDLEEWLARGRADRRSAPDALAVRHSHPEWVVKALRAALLGHGRATSETVDAELEALLASDNAAPRVSLVARPGLATVAELVGSADADASTTVADRRRAAVAGDPGRPRRRPGRARRGPGRGVPARAPSPWRPPSRGHRAASAAGSTCAPARAARRASSAGWPSRREPISSRSRSTRTAPTSSAPPSPRSSGHAASAGRTVEVRTADGREVGRGRARGIRTGPRRRPVHRPRRPAPPSRGALAAPTRRTLPPSAPCSATCSRSALDATAPGGVVAYATCSPHLAETRFVVEDVLRRRGDAEVVDARPHFCGTRRSAAAGARRTARTFSCGRTSTARTRCSWPCSGRGDACASSSRPMTPADARAVGRLHHRSWVQTYGEVLP